MIDTVIHDIDEPKIFPNKKALVCSIESAKQLFQLNLPSDVEIYAIDFSKMKINIVITLEQVERFYSESSTELIEG